MGLQYLSVTEDVPGPVLLLDGLNLGVDGHQARWVVHSIILNNYIFNKKYFYVSYIIFIIFLK